MVYVPEEVAPHLVFDNDLQWQVLTSVSRGYPYPQIAEELGYDGNSPGHYIGSIVQEIKDNNGQRPVAVLALAGLVDGSIPLSDTIE